MEKLGLSASIYKKTDSGVYYCKLHFSVFGMYVSGITVRESPKFPEKGLWVQMPFYGNFKAYIEFANDSQLYPYIKDLVLQAVNDYEANVDIDLDNFDMRKALDEVFPD
jgi:hypothetical protein